jgi:glycerol uptake facilitator-like aquaporin
MPDPSLEPPLQPFPLIHRLVAEGLGTGLLLAIIIGFGITAERLAGGNIAIAILGNTIATGAGLVVLITIFGPLSGAHFNPVVSLTFAARREISWPNRLNLFTKAQGLNRRRKDVPRLGSDSKSCGLTQ